jgi:hypothetical protein
MRLRRARSRAVVVSMLGVLAACTNKERATDVASDNLLVTVRRGVMTAPDSVAPGWTRVRVEEAEDSHIVVAFRLPDSITTSEVAAFVTALDTAPATPHPGVAIGGPEVGARSDVVLHLTPGVYVLACVRRGDDGHRHTTRGESTTLHVRSTMSANAALAAPPANAQDVRLVDFAYVGPDRWASGVQWLRIENAGKQDHQLRLARLRDGASLKDWITAGDPDTVATTVTGMARIGPSEVAYLPVDLTPGTYVVYCLIPDLKTHRVHVELGMLREIHVR